MDEFEDLIPDNRLRQLDLGEGRESVINRKYSSFIRSLRYILPFIALIMTVIVLTWDEAGRRIEPMKKQELVPQSENIQNELLKPVFNSVDDKNQPYSVTADKASQNRENPDLIELINPVAGLTLNDGGKIDAKAKSGLYQQKDQKLNLEGDVNISNDGYTLSTQELRIDLVTQKAFSGRDVTVTGPAGTIDATGLEGDASGGTLIFTGPAKVILHSDGNLLSPKEKAP